MCVVNISLVWPWPDVGHLVLVDHAAAVQVWQAEAEGGDGELDVGAGPRHGDSVPQHGGHAPLAPPPRPADHTRLAHAVDALLGYGRPATK